MANTYGANQISIDVCNGGTLPHGTQTFVFTSSINANCQVDWKDPKPPGSGHVTITNGTSQPVNCQSWHAATYYYTSNCGCHGEGNPAVIMQ